MTYVVHGYTKTKSKLTIKIKHLSTIDMALKHDFSRPWTEETIIIL